MKKLFLLVFCISFVNTLFADDLLNRVRPDEASYKIEGDFNYRIVNGTVQYELTNVVPTGFVLPKKSVYVGQRPEGKEVMFTFEQIKPIGDFPGFYNISYWYLDPDTHDWQPDVEIKKGEQTKYLNKDITMMLLLDCSSSLVSDFNKVKRSAVNFLQNICTATGGSGHVHIGVIGFSSIPDTKMLAIRPLTNQNCRDLCNQINSWHTSNGTALFYAWDRAIDFTQQYIESGSMSNYQKSHFITFTDGIDQTSQDLDHKPQPIVTADAYYDYIISEAKGKLSNYESDVVFVKGVDITNQQQQVKFEGKLQQLAVPNDKQHYERLESIDRLEQKFKEIADRLTESWKVLDCYVAPARVGRVCWTFGKKEAITGGGGPKPEPEPKPEPKPLPKPIKTRHAFVGINGGFGLPYEYISYEDGETYYSDYYGWTNSYYTEKFHHIGLNVKFGIDFALPINDRFAMGAYTSFEGGPSVQITDGYGTKIGYGIGFKAGLLMLAGDLNDKPHIIGISPCLGFAMSHFNYLDINNYYLPIEFRIGRVIREHFYFTFDLTAGVPIGEYNKNYFNTSLYFEPAFTFGYHFGDKLKVK
ncbi:MAG: hypothetical protein IJ756_08090 [Paludibacteraceae bacterium]|nr:hypothetical protein [Paludibacteraceae bacterium]